MGLIQCRPATGERLRAAITCFAESNPPPPTRLRRSKRRLRHNRERSKATSHSTIITDVHNLALCHAFCGAHHEMAFSRG